MDKHKGAFTLAIFLDFIKEFLPISTIFLPTRGNLLISTMSYLGEKILSILHRSYQGTNFFPPIFSTISPIQLRLASLQLTNRRG